MKFSYRMILTLSLGVMIVVWHIIWMTRYTGSQQLQALKPSSAQPSSDFISTKQKSTSNRKNDRELVKVFRPKTAFNTFDILDEIDADAGLVQQGEPPIPGRNHPNNDEKTSYRPEKLRVIVVPHSHNDPGWLKTIDAYFEDQTKFILTNMVEKLQIYKNMTFIWAETVFLSMWWDDLNEASRKAVRKLITGRRLEIVGGGWVLTDEANCHYSAIVDQMVEGHRWLRENIGFIPRNSWSLDSFGYSSLHPYLYRRIGYENAVVQRVSDNVKDRLQHRRGLEFYWRQVWDRNNKTDFFTLMMPYELYSIKHSCGPDREICLMFDFRQIPGEETESRAVPITAENVHRQAALLLSQYRKKADLYRHGVVLVPLGDDFRYDRSTEWDQQYKNYQMLFEYMNGQKSWNVEVRFGILQDYFDEVAKVVIESGKNSKAYFPSLSGDFFPYTDRDDEYWTGYFTTRPFGKMLSRELEVVLRAAEILNSVSIGRNMEMSEVTYDAVDNLASLDIARKSLALFQHHDGIAGTAAASVVQNYEGRLHHGLHLANTVVGAALNYLLSSAENSRTPVDVRVLDPLYSRALASVQVLHLNDDRVKIVLFNPVTLERKELVQLLVDRVELELTDSEGRAVTSQLTATPINNASSESHYLLSFLAELPALGIVTYDLVKTDSPKQRHISAITDLKHRNVADDIVTIENEILEASISVTLGQLMSLRLKHKGTVLDANLRFLFYTSRRSGAYVFAPYVPASGKNFSKPLGISLIRGPVFSEVRIKHSCVTQNLRLVNSLGPIGQVVEVDNVVDMTLSDYDDLELVMRLDSSLKSGDIFYTDQNSYHMMKRRRRANLLLEANYYPSSSVVYVEDERLRLSVITAQPVGASSLESGSIEVMLDRRLRYDDNRGIGAGVTDNKVVLGQFYILPEEISDDSLSKHEIIATPSLLAHLLINSLRNFPIVAATDFRRTLATISLMYTSMSCDTILVNLKAFDDGSKTSNRLAVVLHKQAVSEKIWSPSVELDCNKTRTDVVIADLFRRIDILKVYESSLSFLYREREIPVKQPLNLEAFELYAYEIVFDTSKS